MAVDKGYGSGKPLSAAQSRGRRRVAAGQLSKGGKKVQLNKTLKRIAADNPATGFISGGVSGFKIIAGAMAKAAGKAAQAGNAAAFKEATTLSNQASLAAKFPKSAGAKAILKQFQGQAINYRANVMYTPGGVPKAELAKSGYQIPREEAIAVSRGAAKIIGQKAGGDPGIIELGKWQGQIARKTATPTVVRGRLVPAKPGPYQTRASSTGKLPKDDGIIRGYPAGGPNAERIANLSRNSQSELISRSIQRDIAKQMRNINNKKK